MDSVLGMSTIAEYNGLKIFIVTRLGRHQAPYVKARKAEHEASYTITDGTKRAGYLPKAEERLVLDFIVLHKDWLLKAFEKAKNGEVIGTIPWFIHGSSDTYEGPKLLKIWTEPPSTLCGKFETGVVKRWNMGPDLMALSGSLAKELLSSGIFEKARLDGSLISWPNGFDIETVDLYDLGEEMPVAAKTNQV